MGSIISFFSFPLVLTGILLGIVAIFFIIPMTIVFIYSIPYMIYCANKLSDESYDKLPIANFIKRFFLATKCYICWIIRKQNNHLDRVFPPVE